MAKSMKKLLKHAASAGLCAAATFVAADASASPLFELVGGVSGVGGFNARSTGAGAPSTYFNPALLPKADQGFELSIMVFSEQMSIVLDGRDGNNVPLSVGDRQIVDSSGNPINNATVPTEWLQRGCDLQQCGAPTFAARPRQQAGSGQQTRAYQVIGLVNHIIDRKLVLGFHAIVPLGEFTTAQSFYNDEREQFFSNSLHPEMYSDRLTATSISMGAGSELIEDKLSVGVSFTLNLINSATAGTYVRDSIDYNKLLLSSQVGVKANVSPHFGINFTPTDSWNVSATIHTPQKFIIDAGFGATLPAGNESSTQRRAVHSYLPWKFGVGLQHTLNKGAKNEIAVVGTATYALWENYIDRHGYSPGRQGDFLAFQNMFNGAVGIRHQNKTFRSFADVNYVPSPVPLQVGRTNYVDNDRLGLNVGFDYTFPVMGIRLRTGLQAQAHRLLERYQKKIDLAFGGVVDELPDDARDPQGNPIAGAQGLQTNNPGFPGFGSDGWLLGATGTVAILY